MRTTSGRWIACILGVVVAGGSLAAAADRWLHVRIDDGGDAGERVSLNVPVALIASVLPTIEAGALSGGKLRVTEDLDELDGIDLREVLRAIRDTPDGEFVRIDGPDGAARVAKQGRFLLAHVEDEGQRVRVRLPIDVVQALVGDRRDEIDIAAALDALARFDGEDLVTIEGDENVRIWIDASETGER
jgi:hypothetical protein